MTLPQIRRRFAVEFVSNEHILGGLQPVADLADYLLTLEQEAYERSAVRLAHHCHDLQLQTDFLSDQFQVRLGIRKQPYPHLRYGSRCFSFGPDYFSAGALDQHEELLRIAPKGNGHSYVSGVELLRRLDWGEREPHGWRRIRRALRSVGRMRAEADASTIASMAIACDAIAGYFAREEAYFLADRFDSRRDWIAQAAAELKHCFGSERERHVEALVHV